jgi:hypothetical protein
LRKHETSTAFETNNENLKRKDHPSRKIYVGNGGSSLAASNHGDFSSKSGVRIQVYCIRHASCKTSENGAS